MGRYVNCVALLLLVAEWFLLCANSNTVFPPSCIERERQALLEFKLSLQKVPFWLSSWKATTNCCEWEGIGCDNVTGHVVKLDLSNPCFRPSGLVPNECYYMSMLQIQAPNVSPSLLQLEHLTYLDLTGNDFNSTPIPDFIGNSMGRLRHLSLSFANFGGTIPSNLGNLKNLHYLDLSWSFKLQTNDINWISQLQSLQHLDMSNVHLDEAHNLSQVLAMLPSLSRLYLCDCGINNSLVSLNTSQNMTSLVHLDLSDNNLDSIPSWFSGLKLVTYLDLSNNVIHGPIPEAFRNMSSIVHLDLSTNSLDSIPSWFSAFNLVYLDLSYNVLHGPIPEAFRNMTSIESLYLSNNNFTAIPSLGSSQDLFQVLNMLPSLLRLYLSNCGLDNSLIPQDAFQNMTSLVHLDLSYNNLQGPFLDAFKNLPSIESLLLRENYFTSVPSWFHDFNKLTILDLSNNGLHGPILDGAFQRMSSLVSLSLTSNELSGPIPEAFRNLTSIEYLYLNGNKISGHLPTWLGQLVNLVVLDLSSNSFSGPIPLSLGKSSKLRSLDLSNNRLDGSIPNNIGQLVNLTTLDLSSNKLVGFIPQTLGKLVNLNFLDLSNNSFHGSIPQSLNQLVDLTKLDLSSNKLDDIFFTKDDWSSVMPELWYLNLSNNQISGSLPKNIGYTMPSLIKLFLGSNHLNGSIPISLCETMLHSLDLSKNNLSGEIPNCWKDNQSLYEINLSSNKLSGVFPSSFGSLSTLFWLHLNNNMLQGKLPVSLRNLKQLLILDLGENQFSGSIPSWTADTFPSLQILRLRQNMLSGDIPLQLCQLTPLKILDLSRNKLQGSIPRCIGNLTGMTLDKSLDNFLAQAPTTMRLDPEWSTEVVKEVMKGTELEYIRILKFVVNMDLSENNLVGPIPNGITRLNGLHGLSLANNQLKGEIPKMIGDMKSLESLDLSHNHLSGTIPNSMSALTSLSHLNLSHNELSGPIPKGNQLSTLNDPSIYEENPYLCGSPLPNECPGDISHEAPKSKNDEDDDDKKDKVEKIWFYFVIAAGFASGFWGVIGTLLFKKKWRHAYFRWVEDVADKIYVAVVIKVAKPMMRNHAHG